LIANFKIKNYRLFLSYFFPAVLLLVAFTGLFSWYTNGQFLQNVIFDQVGTYPKENTLQYMFGKMKWIGGVILSLEGPLILFSLVGLFLFWRSRCRPDPGTKSYYSGLPEEASAKSSWKTARESRVFTTYIILYTLATLGSFIFATKGGTVDYIFTLGEPAVAIFSAFGIVWLIQKLSHRIKPRLSWGIGIVLLLILSYPGIRQDILTLHGINYELDAATVNQVVASIQKYAEPNDLIFAPPYFAFLADRKIVGEFSEQFVWFIKYYNYVRYQEGSPKTIEWVESMGNLIANKQVKFVMLNIDPTRGQQTGQIEPIRKAVDEYYEPIGEVRMRNETLTIYLPKN
ncbi:MAG: hypothetical protein QME64_10110, partial [bacterium]|nr:hypothetical protein [bacterium]